jgi:hypothetical protein
VPQVIVRGNPITLEMFYANGLGAAVNPTSPQVSIVDESGVTVVALDVPTVPDGGTGHATYVYDVDANANVGAWDSVWYGIVDGAQVGPVHLGFTVVLLGSISPGSGDEAGTCQAWCVEDDLRCDVTDVDPVVVSQSIQAASNILNRLIGGTWPGSCVDEIRPCGYGSGARWRGMYASTSWPPPLNGGLDLVGWCGCYDSRQCSCRRLSQIELPGYPVTEIVEVVIDGDVVDSARYRLDDNRLLVYLPASADDARQGWPCCQRLDLADTEDDTFSVSYRWGRLPPIDGRMMAARYACQLALASDGDDDCELPPEVVSVARQGLSFSLADPQAFVLDGRVGLADVDTWVQSILLGRKREGASVYFPQMTQRVRRTNTI